VQEERGSESRFGEEGKEGRQEEARVVVAVQCTVQHGVFVQAGDRQRQWHGRQKGNAIRYIGAGSRQKWPRQAGRQAGR